MQNERKNSKNVNKSVEDLLPTDALMYDRTKSWSDMFERFKGKCNEEELANSLLMTEIPSDNDKDEKSLSDEEFEDDKAEEEDDPTFDVKKTLDETLPIIEARRKQWDRCGVTQALEKLDVKTLNEKVGNWLYGRGVYTRKVTTTTEEVTVENSPHYHRSVDSDDSMASVDTAKYILSNRKHRMTNVVTTTIKSYRVFEDKRLQLRAKYRDEHDNYDDEVFARNLQALPSSCQGNLYRTESERTYPSRRELYRIPEERSVRSLPRRSSRRYRRKRSSRRSTSSSSSDASPRAKPSVCNPRRILSGVNGVKPMNESLIQKSIITDISFDPENVVNSTAVNNGKSAEAYDGSINSKKTVISSNPPVGSKRQTSPDSRQKKISTSRSEKKAKDKSPTSFRVGKQLHEVAGIIEISSDASSPPAKIKPESESAFRAGLSTNGNKITTPKVKKIQTQNGKKIKKISFQISDSRNRSLSPPIKQKIPDTPKRKNNSISLTAQSKSPYPNDSNQSRTLPKSTPSTVSAKPPNRSLSPPTKQKILDTPKRKNHSISLTAQSKSPYPNERTLPKSTPSTASAKPPPPTNESKRTTSQNTSQKSTSSALDSDYQKILIYSPKNPNFLQDSIIDGTILLTQNMLRRAVGEEILEEIQKRNHTFPISFSASHTLEYWLPLPETYDDDSDSDELDFLEVIRRRGRFVEVGHR